MGTVIEAWESLLAEAVDSDEDVREYAVFRIGLILESHYKPNQAADVYEENLDRRLLRVVLTEDRQLNAIVYLLAVASRFPSTSPSCIYAIRCASPALYAQPLAKFAVENISQLRPKAVFEIIRAIQVAFQAGTEVSGPFLDKPVQNLLDRWVQSGDTEIAAAAERALDLMEDILEASAGPGQTENAADGEDIP